MKFRMLCVSLLIGLTACAQIPVNKEVEQNEQSDQNQEAEPQNLPKQNLTAPILFAFLVGETALQRGNLEVAINRYVKLAKTTRDPRIAKRATEIALHTGNPYVTEQAASIWIELEPFDTWSLVVWL